MVTLFGLHRARQQLGRLGEWWWVPVFYALVVGWTYRGLWHQHGVATGFGWDVIDTHGPDLEFMARELRGGRFSLWNPYDKGGYAVYADPVVGRYYPFAWPFTAWGAAFGVSWWLIQVEFLAHHVAMAACMHGFLRSRGLPVRAAMIGGIGLVVSAPLLIHKGSNILWPLTWVPLVWIAIDAALARPTWRRGVGVAAAFTLCATAGSPPGLFYAALLIAPYGVWRAATVRPAWRPLVRCAAAAAVVAGLVVALAVIPTQTLVAFGSRDRWASGDSFALALSFEWRGVMRGAFAHGAGFPEMYLGAALVLCAACALVQPRRDGGAPQLFALIAIAGFVLVAGATLSALPWLVHHVPGFGLLRIPGRYKLLAAWSLAAAAAYGVAGLDGPRPRAAIIAVVAGLAASIYTVAVHGTSAARPEWWSIAAMAVPCALVAIAACVPRLRGAAISALVLVVLVDAPAFTHRPTAPPAGDVRRLHERDDAVLGRLDGIRDRFRLYDEFVLGERVGQRRAVRDFRGYPAVDPLTSRRYLDVLEYARHEPAILTDFNVRWVLQGYHFRFGTTASFVPPLAGDAAFVSRGDQIFEARNPAPLIAWYGAVTLVGDPKQVLAAVRASGPHGGDPGGNQGGKQGDNQSGNKGGNQNGNQDGNQGGNQGGDRGGNQENNRGDNQEDKTTGARRRAVIEPEAVARVPALLGLAFAEPGAGNDSVPGSVSGALVSYEPDAIAFTIDAPREGVVVLNELAFPGWTVEVDGEPATPVVANYLLRAVHVGPGRHAIRWRFAPPHVRALVDGYLLALAIMLVAAGWPRRPQARDRTHP